MATKDITDAIVAPQAAGTGLSSEDVIVDAATAALLSNHVGGEYVGSGMDFTRDDSNDEIDISAGYCYIIDDSSSTGGSRGAGGNAQIQSTSDSGYDTEIPTDFPYIVFLPTSVSISVTDNTDTDIWINITDVSTNNSVEIRSSSGGGTTSAPSGTNIKLGTINDSNSGDPIDRPNDYPNKTFEDLTVDNSVKDSAGNTLISAVSATGSVTLSSGKAVVDTGVSNTTTATFVPGAGCDTDDAKVGASVRSSSSSGNHEIVIEETTTSVDNPTVWYDIIRVR